MAGIISPTERAAVYQVSDSEVHGDAYEKEAFSKSPNQIPQTEYEEAQAEWDAVTTITAQQPKNCSVEEKKSTAAAVVSSPVISYLESLQHFQKSNPVEKYKKDIKPTLERSGLSFCLNLLFGPPSLRSNLIADRDFIFCLALCPFDKDQTIHTHILQTIYRKLTSCAFDVPRYGNHWDDIGFQGVDPATDLRGGGCLSLVNILYLFSQTNLHQLANEIYTLSRHQTQNFPFCVMSINMTRIALQALRAELLNKEMNKRQNVIEVFNEFYASVFLYMYEVWRDGKKTIEDSGYVLRDTETYCKKNVNKIIKRLQARLRYDGAGEHNSQHSTSDAAFKFSTMDEIAKDKRTLA